MDSDHAVLVERRIRRRFPFELSVRFQSLGGVYRVAGVGRVTNMSSAGILVAYPHEIKAGTSVELRIDWPTSVRWAHSAAANRDRDGGALRAIQLRSRDRAALLPDRRKAVLAALAICMANGPGRLEIAGA